MNRMMFVLCSVSMGFALGGCAHLPKHGLNDDGGLADVVQQTRPYLQQTLVLANTEAAQKVVADRVEALLKLREDGSGLDIESAVQIALLNNKDLQASFYSLGISEADVVQAGRLPNPKFSMLYAKNNGEYKIEQILTFNLFSLFTMPKMQGMARDDFDRTKRGVVLDVLRLAYETRQAYFNAVAANEYVHYSEQVKESAEASAELARRMVKAGNWSQLEQASEQSFYAAAILSVAEVKNQQMHRHEALSRLLGVAVSQLHLPDRLPDLPKSIVDAAFSEQAAFEQRLDLQAMRLETEALAKELGLTKATRFINVLEVGPARVLEGKRADPYKKGVEFSFELPLFDWGDAKVARAEAIYMQAVNRTAQAAINARSEIRESYRHYQASYEMAKHYHDEIVPLGQKILDENTLRYNGMLIGPFELFASARTQVASVNAYIARLNEFWLAQTALKMALVGHVNRVDGE